MSYVIKNLETGAFVAPQGSARSYTTLLQNARVFDTRDSADAAACGNERVLSLEEAVGRAS